MSNDLLWKKSTVCNESEDVWDDSALIRAYDKAIKEVNQRIADKCLESTDSSAKSDPNYDKNVLSVNHWHLGQYCRCSYSEDGIEYEAKIISIDTSNDTCFVKYIGYGNEEQKLIHELKPSLGKRSRSQQIQCLDTKEINSNSDTDYDNSSSHQTTSNGHKPLNRNNNPIDSPSTSLWFMPTSGHSKPMASNEPIVPPPLPLNTDSENDSEAESLASMLMSWYMSGYHTGYYKALKQCRHSCNDCNK